MVRQGVAPELTWEIEYPTTVEEVIEVDEETEEITAKFRLRAQVSVIGVAFTNSNGYQELPVESYIHFSSAGWLKVFEGRGAQVNPLRTYIDRTVEEGEKLRFAARATFNNFYYFNDGSNVRVLRNGDTPPGNTGFSGQTSVEDFLAPYLKDGKISIGPMDVIYAAEIGTSNQSSSLFDLQDVVVLVRFSRVERD